MVKKVKASKEGIEEINQKRQEKGWTKDQNSEVLIIASQEQFKKSLKKCLNITEEEQNIPLDKLNELLIQKKVLTDNNKFQQHFLKLKTENNHKINLKECLKIIELNDIHTPGITYRNWQQFLSGQEIDKNVFEAFCEALGIPNWNDLVEYSPIYQKTTTNQTRLVEGLSLFNHEKQIDLLLEQFPKPTGIFLINNPCCYSRVWMLRRLVMKITEYNPRQCQPVCLDNSPRLKLSSNVDNIQNLFYQKDFLQVENILDSKHLIFTLNADRYDKKSLGSFLEQYWYPLVEHIKKLQPKKSGKIFMFILVSNTQNDWCSAEEIKVGLFKGIINFHQHNIYTDEQKDYLKKELAKVLREIAARLNKEELSEDAQNIALELIKKIQDKQNKTENLLKVIYQHFNCPTTEFASIWQNYP
ncbi:MAG: hypothetical protein KME52_13065 [Desmonostoc geniculatum HA4340-LM1]|jgi:hypothetical protein|nr:hypothetical protein [Desmonostoc geniculatum HA4340-LM1]